MTSPDFNLLRALVNRRTVRRANARLMAELPGTPVAVPLSPAVRAVLSQADIAASGRKAMEALRDTR